MTIPGRGQPSFRARLSELRELLRNPGRLRRLKRQVNELGREVESLRRRQHQELVQKKNDRTPRPSTTVPPELRGPERLLFHMGTHKTGTTSLQKILQRNSPALGLQGVLALAQHRPPPELGAFKYKADFRNRFRTHLEKPEGPTDGWVSAQRQSLLPLLQDCRDLLISDEELLGPPLGHVAYPYPQAAEGLRLLSQLFPDRQLEVILYLRDQAGYIESCYMQMVNVRECIPFEEFYAGLELERLSWLDLADRVASVVGQENLVVRPFATIRSGFEAFATDFLQLFCDPSPFRIEAVRENPRISALGFDIARATAPLVNDEEWAELRGFLQTAFKVSEYQPPKALLSQRQKNELTKRFAEDTATALARYPRLGHTRSRSAPR